MENNNNNDNYFQVINGIKYDTRQATLLATEERIYEHECNFHDSRLKILFDYNFQTIIDEYNLYKGVNNHYFLHKVIYKEDKFKDKRKNVSLIKEKYIYDQNIIPLEKEKSIEYYFNGLKDNYCLIQLKHLVSEQEAFGEIPVA